MLIDQAAGQGWCYTIAGAIIDNQDLNRTVILGQDAGHRIRQMLRPIVHGDDRADQVGDQAETGDWR
jgi:hypothetical protein